MSGPVSRQSRLSTLGFSGKVCSVAVELLYGRQSAFGDLTEIIDGFDTLVTLKSLQCSEHGVVRRCISRRAAQIKSLFETRKVKL